MFRASGRAFAVNGLRACHDYFFDRQNLLANHLEHLRGAERIHVHVFRNLGHVAAVGCLVKDNVDLVERRGDRFPVADVAFDGFGFGIDPRWLSSAMRIRLKIIEHANLQSFAQK